MPQITITLTDEQDRKLRALALAEGCSREEAGRRLLVEGLRRSFPDWIPETSPFQKRVMDLHPGAATLADDFDAPMELADAKDPRRHREERSDAATSEG